MRDIVASAPAKLNLFLEICSKRGDGFHEIDSIFQEIDLADELTFAVREDDKVILHCNAPGVPLDESNLVVRAANLLRQEVGLPLGAEIVLHTRIPTGGGLGGGSSDAAAALRALVELWELKVSEERLAGLALVLGSDVPFFLQGGVCRCRGRGEEMERIESAWPFAAVLIAPDWGISTAAAYQALPTEEARKPWRTPNALAAAMASGDEAVARRELFNRFEPTVNTLDPREERLADELARLGFETVHMSGSGATLFAFAPSGEDLALWAKRAAECDGVRQAPVVRARVEGTGVRISPRGES